MNRVLTRASVLLLAVSSLGAEPAGQQPATPCAGAGCAQASSPAPTMAADPYQRKQEFVAAIRQFAVRLTGTFGDEGSGLRSDVDAMAAALESWDEAIKGCDRALGRARNADAHVALGTVYLDRYRLDEAVREFGAAIDLDMGRADAHELMALAHGLANRSADVLRALRAAAVLQPEDPVLHYEIARHQLEMGQQAEALSALQVLRAAADKRLTTDVRENGPASPFKRAALLRQPPGVAPIFPPAAYVAAFELLMEGAFAEGIAQCRLAVERDPLLATSSADSDWLPVGSAALRNGDLSAALKHLRAATAADPDRAEAHRILGTASRLDEQFEQSIEHYNAAVRAHPMDERARLALADVLIAVDRFADAEKVLQEAIRVIPGTVQAHYRLGRLYQSVARYAEAVAELEQAARFNPLVGQDPLYEMIGAIYVTQADFSRATTALRKQVVANPNNAEAHRRLGDVYVRQDRTDEALAEFIAALLIDARNVESYVSMSQVHLQAGQYDEAIRSARAALKLEAAQKEAQYVLAMSLLRLGQTEAGNAALREFQRLQAEAAAASRLKFEIDTLRRESMVSLADADYAKAISLLGQLIAREPAVASHYVNLGDALMKSRQPDQAIEKFEEAVKLEPSNPDSRRRLAEAYGVAGRADSSRREADRYRALIDAAKRERLLRLGNP